MKKILLCRTRLVTSSIIAGFAASIIVFSLFFISQDARASGSSSGSIDLPDTILRLEVIDSFVELRTGPGRAYPVFYVIEQGERVEVQVRRAGWYEVRTQSGKTGWATLSQLSRTLQSTGEPADLPTVSFGDYLKNKWRIGFTAGEFFNGDLEGSDIFTATASYRLLSWFSTELEWGKLFNSESEGDLYAANLLFEPYSKHRLSPELLIGAGQLSLKSQPELAALDNGDSDFFNYGLGLNFYLGRNFVVRGEYRHYRVSSDDGNENLDSWKIGFNTFF